jgi:hypothetical protein
MQDYDSSATALAPIIAIVSAMIIPIIIIWVVMVVAHWKIYEKAGKPGWAAIVPIYNIIVLLEIVGKPVWWILLLLVPCVNIIFLVWITNLLSKSFGQSEGFTVGLLLLGIVFYPMLGFGNYQYVGPAGIPGGLRPVDPLAGYKDPFGNTPPPPPMPPPSAPEA